MATRTQSRDAVIGIMYAIECGNDSAISQADIMLEEKKIKNKQKEFALGLLNGILEHKEAIDSIIKEYLKEWDMERLGIAERNILRLGGYEILYTDTDLAVIINECVELSKSYGDDSAHGLINGVLDNIGKAKKKDNK